MPAKQQIPRAIPPRFGMTIFNKYSYCTTIGIALALTCHTLLAYYLPNLGVYWQYFCTRTPS
jgi:hypothetical protein